MKVVHYCWLDLGRLYILLIGLTALTRFIKLKTCWKSTFVSLFYRWHLVMTNRSWTFAVWYLACTFTGLYWANIKLKTCWKTKVGPNNPQSGTLLSTWSWSIVYSFDSLDNVYKTQNMLRIIHFYPGFIDDVKRWLIDLGHLLFGILHLLLQDYIGQI